MAKFAFESEICSITDEKMRNIPTYFHKKLIEKDDQIVSLTNQVTELESRVIQLERYSSKDMLELFDVSGRNQSLSSLGYLER